MFLNDYKEHERWLGSISAPCVLFCWFKKRTFEKNLPQMFDKFSCLGRIDGQVHKRGLVDLGVVHVAFRQFFESIGYSIHLIGG